MKSEGFKSVETGYKTLNKRQTQILSFKKILGLMGVDVRLSGNVLKYDIILDCLFCF